MQKNLLLTFILCFTLSSLLAQTKFEKEVHIPVDSVPEAAIHFLDSLGISSKVRWYKETGIASISYEAKTHYQKQKLSIEFSSSGEFEDLEIEIPSNEIPVTTLKAINLYLNTEFNKFKIQKAQIQYKGNAQQITLLLSSKNVIPAGGSFELIISTKTNGSFKRYELLFDANGKLVRRQLIIDDMTDNLDF